jgi:hypothetical protein
VIQRNGGVHRSLKLQVCPASQMQGMVSACHEASNVRACCPLRDSHVRGRNISYGLTRIVHSTYPHGTVMLTFILTGHTA